jgi:hypothetical protein
MTINWQYAALVLAAAAIIGFGSNRYVSAEGNLHTEGVHADGNGGAYHVYDGKIQHCAKPSFDANGNPTMACTDWQ